MNDDIKDQALEIHKKLKGKLRVEPADQLSFDKLKLYYTPGVGAVSSYVAQHPEEAGDYTGVGNNVAIVSDGTAVLGLGDIGPLGALPVMEGKAMLFKQFGGVNGHPIVLSTKDPQEIIKTVINIAPSFGGINLEDIAAPNCFLVERTLIEKLNIPVFHDDQHGTAIVTLAGLINAFKVVKKDITSAKIAIIGAGAAGNSVAKLINAYAPQAKIIVVDSKGIISKNRNDLDEYKKELLEFSNPESMDGNVHQAIFEADAVIGLSKPGQITPEDIKNMNENPIILAMANPIPEIFPDEAKAAGAAVVGTGRSDFPNQINNALVFPGLFRGAFDNKIKRITTDHKLNAAKALAGLIENPTAEEIIPRIDTPGLAQAIAGSII